MSTLVAQLENSGYVKRKPDPSDKRAWLLVLTPKGEKVREAGQAINYEFEKKWEAKLGNKDYQELRHLLARLCE